MTKHKELIEGVGGSGQTIKDALDASAHAFELILNEQLKVCTADLIKLPVDTPWKAWLLFVAAQLTHAYTLFSSLSPCTVGLLQACVSVTQHHKNNEDVVQYPDWILVKELKAQALHSEKLKKV